MHNAELAAPVDTSDDWIRERTGIGQRHLAADGELTSDLATQRRRAALARAGIERRRHRPDPGRHLHPGPHLPGHGDRGPAQARHAGRGIAFDLQAVCAGFVYALATADNFIRAGQARDRAGDRGGDLLAHPRLGRPRHLRAVRRRRRRGGAARGGAAGSATDRGILATHLCRRRPPLQGSLCRRRPLLDATTGHLRMNGREVFRCAVAELADGASTVLDQTRLHPSRHRLAGAAPGQPADHRRRRQAPAAAGGEGDRHRRAPRQHLGGLIPLALDEGVEDGRIRAGRSRLSPTPWAAASPGAPPRSAGSAQSGRPSAAIDGTR